MELNVFTILSIILSSTVLGSIATTFMLRAKTKAEASKTESDKVLNEADFVTKKYKELYDMLQRSNEELEKQNEKLENEIIRSKREESVCRNTLQEYKERLDKQEVKISELEAIVKNLSN